MKGSFYRRGCTCSKVFGERITRLIPGHCCQKGARDGFSNLPVSGLYRNAIQECVWGNLCHSSGQISISIKTALES